MVRASAAAPPGGFRPYEPSKGPKPPKSMQKSTSDSGPSERDVTTSTTNAAAEKKVISSQPERVGTRVCSLFYVIMNLLY
jgi:hypothetical protein